MKDITNTKLNARAWDDILLLVEPNSAPLLNQLAPGSEAIGATTYEWYEKRNFNTKAKAVAAIAAGDTTITVDDIMVFAEGQSVAIDDEKVIVTAVNQTTNVITTLRGQYGTTAAAHDSEVDMFVTGTESEEGGDARVARNIEEVKKINYTEIFKETIEISGSQLKRKLDAQIQSARIAGLPITDDRVQSIQSDIFTELELEKYNEICGQIEKAFNLGTAYTDSTGKIRKLGGLKNFIVSNIVDGNNTAEITSDLFDTFVDNIAETGAFDTDGGSGYIFWVSPQIMKKLKDLKLLVVDQVDNGTLGVIPISRISTTQGVFPVMPTRNVGSKEIYFVNSNHLSVKIFRDFTTTDWNASGKDTYNAQILGELTLEVKNEEQMGTMKNLKIS